MKRDNLLSDFTSLGYVVPKGNSGVIFSLMVFSVRIILKQPAVLNVVLSKSAIVFFSNIASPICTKAL